MSDDIIDLLKIKIEKAKRELPLETVNAIDAIDWQATIFELRTKKGYTFEQLGDLELETELLLAGLVSIEEYPRELENRMKISRAAANELVNEMDNLVFKKIRAELIKNIERKKIFQKNSPPPEPAVNKSEKVVLPITPRPNLGENVLKEGGNLNKSILNKTGIEIIPEKIEIGTTFSSTSSEQPAENREDLLKKIEKPDAYVKSYGDPKEEIHPMLAQKLSNSVQTPTVKTEHTLDNIPKADSGNPIETKPKVPAFDPYREVPE